MAAGDGPAVTAGEAYGDAVAADVDTGVGPRVGLGVAVTGVAYGVGRAVGDDVAGVGGEVAAAVSSGVGGRGKEGPGTSLAWLAGGNEGLLGTVPVGLPGTVPAGLLAGEGLLVGLLAGEVPEGQRPQLAAQYPPAGAPDVNMKPSLHLPKLACNNKAVWPLSSH